MNIFMADILRSAARRITRSHTIMRMADENGFTGLSPDAVVSQLETSGKERGASTFRVPGSALIEGGVGIFGFADLANFWFGFSVFALKNCGFSVLVFRAVCGFSPI